MSTQAAIIISVLLSVIAASFYSSDKKQSPLKKVKLLYSSFSFFTFILGLLYLTDFSFYYSLRREIIHFPDGRDSELADVIGLIGIALTVFAAFDALLFSRKDIEEKGDLVIEAVTNLSKAQREHLDA